MPKLLLGLWLRSWTLLGGRVYSAPETPICLCGAALRRGGEGKKGMGKEKRG